MRKYRIIPSLLLKDEVLVKGTNFKHHRYVGDPINAVKIFSMKEVDELCFLDISATLEKRKPSIDLIRDIADESFVPFSVGGGVNSVDIIGEIIEAGAEKVVLNSYAIENIDFIKESSNIFGSQSVVVSIDVVLKNGEYVVYTHCGMKRNNYNFLDLIKAVTELGAGEILLTSVDKEGTWSGFDLDLIKKASLVTNIPIVLGGGAGCIYDFKKAVSFGASAVAIGSMFVFYGAKKSVLINTPDNRDIEGLFYEK